MTKQWYTVPVAIMAIVLFAIEAGAQTARVDSILRLISGGVEDSVRFRLMTEAGNELKMTEPDSALIYYTQAEELAGRIAAKTKEGEQRAYFSRQALALKLCGNVYLNTGDYEKARDYYFQSAELYLKAKDLSGLSACYSNRGLTHSFQGEYEKALEEYGRALKIAKQLNDPKILSQCYTNIGIVYDEKGHYNKALEYYIAALKIDEKSGDELRMAVTYSNIGIVYKAQGLFDKSVSYYEKALTIYERTGAKKQWSDCLNNLGNVHMARKNYDQALDCYNRALDITKETGDRRGMSATLSNLGNLHHAMGEYNKVEAYYQQSLVIKQEIGDRYGMALLYTNMADLYITLTDSAALTEGQRKSYLAKALEYGRISYEMGREMEVLPWINSSAGTLMTAYRKLGDYRTAMTYAEIFINTRDTLVSEEQTRVLAEMESRYENEKKQLQIEKMQSQKLADDKTIQAQQAENRRQQIILFSVVAGLILIVIFSVIVFRMFRQKRRDNILLAQQNNEIRQQKEEILSQRDEITIQRDQLQSQKKEITDSIAYAQRIQSALLPDLSNVLVPQLKDRNGESGLVPVDDYFILYKPRDIVSGDFYWATRVNEWLLFTVADCTGHGVPGAFMSMLGISFLNEIVRKKEITDAATVLNHLRDAVIESLRQQKGFSHEIMATTVKDGMDIAFCALNTQSLELQFAGANNSLYLVSGFWSLVPGEVNQQLATSNQQLVEIKGDKMPIGIHERMHPFTLHTVSLSKGDMLYLASDGFADQCGGPGGKKFLSKNFRSLLSDISGLPSEEQRTILDARFEEWRGTGKQMDDVTVFGLKI